MAYIGLVPNLVGSILIGFTPLTSVLDGDVVLQNPWQWGVGWTLMGLGFIGQFVHVWREQQQRRA